MKLALVALLCLARLNFSPLAFACPKPVLDYRAESDHDTATRCNPNAAREKGGRKDDTRWHTQT